MKETPCAPLSPSNRGIPFVEGKSYKEIADILQITEEQVKVTLFRARQKIKQRYTEIEDYGLLTRKHAGL